MVVQGVVIANDCPLLLTREANIILQATRPEYGSSSREDFRTIHRNWEVGLISARWRDFIRNTPTRFGDSEEYISQVLALINSRKDYLFDE